MLRFATFIVVATLALPAAAQTVFQCRRDGVQVFQDRPCGGDQVVREIVAPPAGDVAPGIAEMVADWERRADVRHGRSGPARARGAATRAVAPRSAESHRCTTATGAVFYRHGACPARIAGPTRRGDARDRRDAGEAVGDEPVARAEACREIGRAAAATRNGHEHDAHTDTYDRNLGRDPCR